MNNKIGDFMRLSRLLKQKKIKGTIEEQQIIIEQLKKENKYLKSQSRFSRRRVYRGLSLPRPENSFSLEGQEDTIQQLQKLQKENEALKRQVKYLSNVSSNRQISVSQKENTIQQLQEENEFLKDRFEYLRIRLGRGTYRKIISPTFDTEIDYNLDIKYYNGCENKLFEILLNRDLEIEKWKKIIDILTLLETEKTRNILKELLFPPYSHSYWNSSITFNIVSMKANRILASLVEPDEFNEKEVDLLVNIISNGTKEAKIACVNFLSSFREYLLHVRLFEPLLNLWKECKSEQSSYTRIVTQVLKYFVKSMEKIENNSYEIIFNTNVRSNF